MMKFLVLLVFLVLCKLSFGQQPDSLVIPDSMVAPVVVKTETVFDKINTIINENSLLNTEGKSESFTAQQRKPAGKEIIFYSIAAVLLFFGMLKVFYSRYLSNLFRVFFNTSLRQSQLTDQLLQAKLPSLLFNIFFLLIGGFYIYFLLQHFEKIPGDNNYRFLVFCFSALAIIYTAKYLVLKFAGWVSGFNQEADTYIFIIFLINKIIGIALIPIVIILAFSGNPISYIVVVISLVIVFLLIMLRFLRSYSLLRHKLRINTVHFLLYILGVELLPILLILKASAQLLENS